MRIVFILNLLLFKSAIGYSENIFDYLQKSNKDIIIHSYGQGDTNTFDFLARMDSALGNEIIYFISSIDNYDLKNFFEYGQTFQYEARSDNSLCLNSYLKRVSALYGRFFGYETAVVSPYLKNKNPELWSLIDSTYLHDFGLGLEKGFRNNYIYASGGEQRVKFYNLYLKNMCVDPIDSILLYRTLVQRSIRDPCSFFKEIKDIRTNNRIVEIVDYWPLFDIRRGRIGKQYKDLNCDNIIFVNLIYADAFFKSSHHSNGNIPAKHFSNEINGSHVTYDIISYEDLPNKISIFDNITVKKKYFKNALNVFIQSTSLCMYKDIK